MDGTWVPAACRSVSWRFLLIATGAPLLLTALVSLSLTALVFIVTSFIGATFGVSSIVSCRGAEPGVLPERSVVVSDLAFGRIMHKYVVVAGVALLGLLIFAVVFDLMAVFAVWIVLVGAPWSLVVGNATFGAYVERTEVRTGLRLVMRWEGIGRYLTTRRPDLLLVGENVIPGAPLRRR